MIALVSLDIAGIFASFLIDLHICEHGGDKGFERRPWVRSEEVIDAFSLMFSCLFMAELLGSVFAFGFAYVYSSPPGLCGDGVRRDVRADRTVE